MISQPKPAQEIIQEIATQLFDKYGDKELCTQYAWWVLESITQKNKASLLAQQAISLTQAQQQKLSLWIEQQVHGNIPLQYLIGTVPFAHGTFLVEPPTLIPRQETEEWCLDIIAQLSALPPTPIRILDIGTGTGCIAISLAHALPHAQIIATDISADALSLAQKNAALNSVTNIRFISSDLFTAIPKDCTFDIIISNPPYISTAEWRNLDPSVKDWEDTNALIAPDNGIGILKKIITNASAHLVYNEELAHKNIPNLMVEIGYQQGKEVQRLFSEAGFKNVGIKKDLHGNDRLVYGYIDVGKKEKI